MDISRRVIPCRQAHSEAVGEAEAEPEGRSLFENGSFRILGNAGEYAVIEVDRGGAKAATLDGGG